MATVQVGIIENGVKHTISVPEPDTCPMCAHGIEAQLQIHHSPTGTFFPRVDVVFRCPRVACQELFLARYERTIFGWQISRMAPVAPKEPYVHESIQRVSPDFVDIFKQASHAELIGLRKIAGTGYRKALEFLIKDYLIEKRPDEEPAIRKAQLANCIQDFIDDKRVKEVARRATWLGNDESHYSRLREDKTLNDLKRLVDLTVRWIAMEYATEEAISEMPEPRRP